MVLRLNRLSIAKGNKISTRSCLGGCTFRIGDLPVVVGAQDAQFLRNESPFKWGTEAYTIQWNIYVSVCNMVCVCQSHLWFAIARTHTRARSLYLYLSVSAHTHSHTNFAFFRLWCVRVCARVCNCIISAFRWKWKTFRKCHINIYFVLKLHKITIGCQLSPPPPFPLNILPICCYLTACAREPAFERTHSVYFGNEMISIKFAQSVSNQTKIISARVHSFAIEVMCFWVKLCVLAFAPFALT